MLELAGLLNCEQIIYAGSLSSYPNFDRTMSSYGLTKSLGRDVLGWGSNSTGMNFCSLDLTQLYDDQGRCCIHQPWIGRIIAYASRGLSLQLPQSAGVRNFLHVNDAARLLVKAASIRLSGSWPLCGRESFTMTEFARKAYDVFGEGGAIGIDQSKVPFRAVRYPDSKATYTALGDSPIVDLETGLQRIKKLGTAVMFGPLDVK